MKKSWLLAALIPLLFIIAWWIGYSLYGESGTSSSSSSYTSSSPVSVTPKPEKPKTRVIPDAPDEADETPPSDPDPVIEPIEKGPDPLEFIGWEIDERSRDAKVCFAFRQPFNPADNLKVRDYIEIRPSFKFAQTVSGNDLCISGFDWAKDYFVTIKEGLPGLNDRKLISDITETITFGDKPQYVGFVGQGIILPRIGAQGLAIETMNIDSLLVEIARVSDRMIARRTPQIGQTVAEGRYGYAGRDAATQVRVKIWDGEVDIEKVKNENVTTVLPLTEMIGELEPGAYIVSVKRKHEENVRNYAQAWRWIIVTDLAITSYRGDNGMNVTVRSIDSARLQPGIDVLLVAENNEIIAKEQTDGSGHVFFAPALLDGTGPKTPKMILAYGNDQDFALLDLNRSNIPMEDQDISGRRLGGDTDIYSFTERGVYRPGEDVHFTVMMRDREAMAQTDMPVTLSVHRPNGLVIETKRIESEVIKKQQGTIHWGYELPRSSERGNWRLSVKADGSKQMHNVGFAVEDFVPQKLRLTIKSEDKPIRLGEIRDLSVDAQFLYGAPGTALQAEAEARIRLDNMPFKDYAEYGFGPHKRSFRERFVELGTSVTDAAGIAEFGFDYKNNPVTSIYPLRAEIVAGVAEPGGRYVREAKNIPLRSEDVYVGLAKGYTGYTIPSGSPAKFKIIAVDSDGKAIRQKLNWKLWQEDWNYQWYRQNGRWQYKYDRRDLPISDGALSTKEAGPSIWNHTVTSGRFRLELFDGTKLLASRRFWSGWGRSDGNSDAPDSLEVNTVNQSVSRGDQVNLTVRAPYGGEGELVIASDKVHLVKPLSLTEGTSDVSFKFDPSWGDSVYALMTLYTPRDISDRPVPRRAIGVSYIALDRSDQVLELEMDVPEVIRPRQKYVMNVKVDGAQARNKVLMNVAAVDEGILQITKYNSPDAAKHFLAKKALGIRFMDDYGRILNPNLGAPSKVRSGGDSLGGEGLTVVPTKTVALFKEFVPVRNGVAKVEFEIPDFNGELRLMATAWNDKAFGSVSAPIKVRDQVPAIIGMPRFLAPGDKAKITLSLDNVEGKVGNYNAKITAGGVLNANESLMFDLEQGERQQKRIDIAAGLTGVEDVNLKIDGPGNYNVSSVYPIQVRSPFYPTSETKYVELPPQESLSLTSEWIEKYVPEATDVTVSFTKLPGIDPAPIVKSLRKYPYGCTEQTVSTALPLIYAGDLGGIPGQTDLSRKRAVQDAIYQLSNRVSKDGSFGLWKSGDRYAYSWVGVYATDFMYRAQAEGFYVPENILDRITDASRTLSKMPRYSSLRYYAEREQSRWDISRRAESAAYAHYVLAMNGEGNLGKVRYHFDNHRDKMRTPVSFAYLGGALKLLGDDRRSGLAFEDSRDKMKHVDRKNYYYSNTRDLAGYIAIASEVGEDDLAIEQLETLSKKLRNKRYLNTQEKGYLILAFRSLMKNVEPAKIKAKNTGLTKTNDHPVANMFGADLDLNPEFKNVGTDRIFAAVTVEGPPKEAPPAISNEIAVTKALFSKEGNPIVGGVKQGDQVVVKVTYRSANVSNRSVVIADLLPAGFEVETILKPSDGLRTDGRPKGPYSWLGKITGHQIAEKRDDRFVGSLSIYNSKPLTSAYVMRAVTPGDFVLPGAVVEDMYRPEEYGTTEAGRISISADPEL